MKTKRRQPTAVRFNEKEKEIVTQAANALDLSLSEFIRDAACRRAKTVISSTKKEAEINA
jgi:uncharacterized protein (DUF1778 family)